MPGCPTHYFLVFDFRINIKATDTRFRPICLCIYLLTYSFINITLCHKNYIVLSYNFHYLCGAMHTAVYRLYTKEIEINVMY